MRYDNEYCPEPFGPEWVRPAAAPCPNCECCSARLCELAASKRLLEQNCAYHGERSLWDQLIGCPCPRAAWSDAQRDGAACVFCGATVDRDDKDRTVLIGMNMGLVAGCTPCMDTYRASLTSGEPGGVSNG